MMIPGKRDTLGDIPDRFDTTLANALNQREERPMKRKVSTALWVMAALVVLLAATALAMGLRRSAEADAVYKARQAISGVYQLTTETFGLFSHDARQEGPDWIVTFTGEIFPDEDKLGTYTVRIAPNGEARATWSHDDVDPDLWTDGNPGAPVWGQAQMIQALVDKEREWEAYLEIDWSRADFETVAAYGGNLLLENVQGGVEYFRPLVPLADDLSVEDARQIATQALRETYAIGAKTLGTYQESISFAEPEGGGARQFILEYSRNLTGYENLAVQVASPSGEVLGCRWNLSSALRTLPSGPLDGYRHAVEEFMASGALAVQPAQTKADIVQRVKDAGWADLIQPALPYVSPGSQNLSEADALAAANRSLMERYAFTEEGLTLLHPIMSLLEIDRQRWWHIEYEPLLFADHSLNRSLDKIGRYTVTLDAQSGHVTEAAWDLADDWDGQVYTRENWAQAPVYPGHSLAWVHELAQALDDIAGRYPKEEATIYSYTLEDIAAYDALFRGAGFPASEYPHSLPAPGELSQEEAVVIAKEALLLEMDVSEAELASAEIVINFTAQEPTVPTWGISLRFIHEGIFVDFGVSIDAKTGEILLTNSITGANG